MGRPKKIESELNEASRSNRLVIPLTQNNEIDWESVRPSVKEQYLSIVNQDVATLEHIGMAHESTSSDDDVNSTDDFPQITSENIRTAFDILSQTNALAFRMLVPRVFSSPIRSQVEGRKVPLQIDLDIALSCFKLTDKQHAEIDPRAMRLAKKYMPAGVKQNLDIWLLATMYLKFQGDNAVNAMKLQNIRDLGRLSNSPATSAPKSPTPDSDLKSSSR